MVKFINLEEDSMTKFPPKAKSKKVKCRMPWKPNRALKETHPLTDYEVICSVNALLQVIKKRREENKKSLFKDDAEEIVIQVQAIKIPVTTAKLQLRVPLPHSMLNEKSDVCLITRNERKSQNRDDYEPTIAYYKELLEKQGITNKIEIVPIGQLRGDCMTWEGKGRFANLYDLYLVDGRIFGNVTKILGSRFFKRHKTLIPVKLNSKKVKLYLERALSKTSMVVHGNGDSYSAQIGYCHYTAEQLVANIQAFATALANNFPGGFDNIRKIFIKSKFSMAIPIYISLSPANDVPIPVVDLSLPKAYKMVEGELTTKKGGYVKVYPSGKVEFMEVYTKEDVKMGIAKAATADYIRLEDDSSSDEETCVKEPANKGKQQVKVLTKLAKKKDGLSSKPAVMKLGTAKLSLKRRNREKKKQQRKGVITWNGKPKTPSERSMSRRSMRKVGKKGDTLKVEEIGISSSERKYNPIRMALKNISSTREEAESSVEMPKNVGKEAEPPRKTPIKKIRKKVTTPANIEFPKKTPNKKMVKKDGTPGSKKSSTAVNKRQTKVKSSGTMETPTESPNKMPIEKKKMLMNISKETKSLKKTPIKKILMKAATPVNMETECLEEPPNKKMLKKDGTLGRKKSSTPVNMMQKKVKSSGTMETPTESPNKMPSEKKKMLKNISKETKSRKKMPIKKILMKAATPVNMEMESLEEPPNKKMLKKDKTPGSKKLNTTVNKMQKKVKSLGTMETPTESPNKMPSEKKKMLKDISKEPESPRKMPIKKILKKVATPVNMETESLKEPPNKKMLKKDRTPGSKKVSSPMKKMQKKSDSLGINETRTTSHTPQNEMQKKVGRHTSGNKSDETANQMHDSNKNISKLKTSTALENMAVNSPRQTNRPGGKKPRKSVSSDALDSQNTEMVSIESTPENKVHPVKGKLSLSRQSLGPLTPKNVMDSSEKGALSGKVSEGKQLKKSRPSLLSSENEINTPTPKKAGKRRESTSITINPKKLKGDNVLDVSGAFNNQSPMNGEEHSAKTVKNKNRASVVEQKSAKKRKSLVSKNSASTTRSFTRYFSIKDQQGPSA